MKKKISILIMLLFIFATFSNIFALSKRIDWFVKSVKDHKQPLIMDGGDLYHEYGVKAVGNDKDKVIYLTFDAGYENGNVDKILDTLKKHDVKAAFFILPAIIKYNKEVVQRMADEGHIVGNHTMTHKDISYMSIEELKKELNGLEQAYSDATGHEMTKYFRPPEGSFSVKSLEYLHSLGYKTVFWSFAYADWDNNKQPSYSYALNKILDNVHNGMVMLLHPNSATNAVILDEVITTLLEQGYTFELIDKLYNE